MKMQELQELRTRDGGNSAATLSLAGFIDFMVEPFFVAISKLRIGHEEGLFHEVDEPCQLEHL